MLGFQNTYQRKQLSGLLLFGLLVAATGAVEAQSIKELLKNAVKEGVNQAKGTVQQGLNQYTGNTPGNAYRPTAPSNSSYPGPTYSSGQTANPGSSSYPGPSYTQNSSPSGGSSSYPGPSYFQNSTTSSGSSSYPGPSYSHSPATNSGSTSYPGPSYAAKQSAGENYYSNSAYRPQTPSGSTYGGNNSSGGNNSASSGSGQRFGPGGMFVRPDYNHRRGKDPNDTEVDPMAIRKAAEAEREANAVPPPPPIRINKPPGTDDTAVYGIPAIETAALKKVLNVSIAGRFNFIPDGGKPGTPWWVVDGYSREPSIFDP